MIGTEANKQIIKTRRNGVTSHSVKSIDAETLNEEVPTDDRKVQARIDKGALSPPQPTALRIAAAEARLARAEELETTGALPRSQHMAAAECTLVESENKM